MDKGNSRELMMRFNEYTHEILPVKKILKAGLHYMH